MLLSLCVVAALASSALAKRCINSTIPVHLSSRQGLFNNSILPTTNLQTTTFIQYLVKQGSNFTAQALAGYQTKTGNYSISAQFCAPDNMTTKSPVVQVLTHGLGFDKSYWDLAFDNYNYSYVNAATAAGYCTLSYDRIGIGNSSHGDPLNEIQINLEVQGLRALTQLLINGSYPGVNHTFNASDIVHVGHSFGSAQTYLLAEMYPEITGGIVLTGFTTNSSFMGAFLAGGNFMQARLNAPLRFGNVTGVQAMSLLFNSPLADYLSGIDLTTLPAPQNLSPGYVVANNVEANQLLFLYPGNFDPLLQMQAEETKEPATVGELLTAGSLPKTSNFTKPVFVINGNGDLPYCGGDCSATGIPGLSDLGAAVKTSFPSLPASKFASYVQPNTGHGINLHYNASAAYQQIFSFLKNHSLISH